MKKNLIFLLMLIMMIGATQSIKAQDQNGSLLTRRGLNRAFVTLKSDNDKFKRDVIEKTLLIQPLSDSLTLLQNRFLMLELLVDSLQKQSKSLERPDSLLLLQNRVLMLELLVDSLQKQSKSLERPDSFKSLQNLVVPKTEPNTSLESKNTETAIPKEKKRGIQLPQK